MIAHSWMADDDASGIGLQAKFPFGCYTELVSISLGSADPACSAFAKQAPGQNGGRMGDISQKDSAHTVRGVPLFDGCGIDHIGIRYRDLKKAVGWFRDTLARRSRDTHDGVRTRRRRRLTSGVVSSGG